jgi:F-type H+-transporting ATPase subunit alpha
MAQYNELAAFAQFGAELDKASMAQLNRGARLVELLKQAQYSPVPMEEQVVAIFAANNGFLDPIPMEKVKAFEAELIGFMRSKKKEILEEIRKTNDLPEALQAKVKAAIEEFSKGFLF